MSLTLQAPFDIATAIIALPNPEFGDEEGLDAEVSYEEALDGTPFTYIVRKNQRKLTFTFENVGRGKMLEMLTFFEQFAHEFIRLTDHNSNTWKVCFSADSLSVTHQMLSSPRGGPRDESGSFTLEFLAERVT
jgi:hypothetical protein